MALRATRSLVSQTVRRYHAPAVAHPIYLERHTAFDPSNPAQLIKVETDAALASKEQGPWTELSKDDKVALYRAQFANSMAEVHAGKPKDTPIVFFGVGILFAIGVTFFAFLKKYVGPSAPYTFTPEWQEDQKKKMQLYRMNPITGVSSKK